MRFTRYFFLALAIGCAVPHAPVFAAASDINAFIHANSVAIRKVENAEQAKKLAFDYFQEKFGEVNLGGKIADFAGLAENPEFLESINDSLSSFGDYLTYYNLVNQIYHNQQPEAMVTAVKFAYGKALEKLVKELAWEGLKKSLLAVDIIDFSLSKFISTTLEDYKEFWKGFYYHYFTHAPYSRQYWFERFKRGGYLEIEKELLAFWDKSDVLVHAGEYGQNVLGINQGLPATYRDAYAAFDQNFRMGLAVNVFKDHIQPRLAYEIEEQAAKAASDAILEMERIEEKIRIKMKDYYFTQESGNLTVILNQPEWEKWVNPITYISVTLKSGKTEKKYDLNEYILSNTKLRKGNWSIRIADRRPKPVFQTANATADLKAINESPETIVEINLSLTSEGEKKVADAKGVQEREVADAVLARGATETDYSKKYFALMNQLRNALSDVLDERIDYKEFKTRWGDARNTYQEYLKADEGEAKKFKEQIAAEKDSTRKDELRKLFSRASEEPDQHHFQKAIEEPMHLMNRKIWGYQSQLKEIVKKMNDFLSEYFQKSALTIDDASKKYLQALATYQPKNLLTEIDFEIQVVTPVLNQEVERNQKFLGRLNGIGDKFWATFTGDEYTKWFKEGLDIVKEKFRKASTLEDRLNAHIEAGKTHIASSRRRVARLIKRYIENDQGAGDAISKAQSAVIVFRDQVARIPQNGAHYQNLITLKQSILARLDVIRQQRQKIEKRIGTFKKNIKDRYAEFQDIVNGVQNGNLETMQKEFSTLTKEKDDLLAVYESFPFKIDIDYTLFKYSMVENELEMYRRKLAWQQQNEHIVLFPEALDRIRRQEEEMRRQQEGERQALEERTRREEEARATFSRSRQIQTAVDELSSISARQDRLRQDTDRTRRFFNDAIAAQNQSSYIYFYLAVKDLLESSERNLGIARSTIRTLQAMGAEGKGKNVYTKIQEHHNAIADIFAKMRGELRPLVSDVSLIEENRGYRTGNLDVEDVQVGMGASSAQQNATVSFAVGGGSELDFATGTLVSGFTGDIGTFGGPTPSFENISASNRIRSMGGMNFNIAPTDTSTYSTFAIEISAGSYYAVITQEGHFGKMYVESLAGGTVTIRWWYQPNGSPVF